MILHWFRTAKIHQSPCTCHQGSKDIGSGARRTGFFISVHDTYTLETGNLPMMNWGQQCYLPYRIVVMEIVYVFKLLLSA